MNRLNLANKDRVRETVEGLYQDLALRVLADPPGGCPVDLTASFVKLCHAQSCGKCIPCRVGLGQILQLLEDVLDGKATEEKLELLKKTAEVVLESADCAIGSEAAGMVLRSLEGAKEDYLSHVEKKRCSAVAFAAVPCVAYCPAGVDIPGYVALVAAGRYADAVRLIRKDNPFPTACAYICEHPCESHCRRHLLDDAVNIRGLKKYAVDNSGSVPVPAAAEATGKTAAVIGGGPSGLTAAYFLTLMGHKVTVFEQREQLGGMMRYGIPAYRFPRELLDEEIKSILSTGIEVKHEAVGKDIGFAELKKQYDCVYISIGAHTDKKLGIEGEDAEGVISAVDMLRGIGDGNHPDFAGKNVVIVGGGNVAMDVTRSAKRLGAASVTCVYRRRQADMTALPEEVESAVAEGCELLTLKAPAHVEVEGGKAVALWVQPQMISVVKGGRPSPKKADAPEERIPADIIIVAIGQAIESRHFAEEGLPVKRDSLQAGRGTEVAAVDGVFAGGDCVSGPATVIKAIAAGKTAAANMDQYLGFHHEISVDVEIPEADTRDRVPCGRVTVCEREARQRKEDFCAVEGGMSREEALQEAMRCLRCDHYGMGAFKGGRKQSW